MERTTQGTDKRHLFLTGEKGIGKTTVIRRVLTRIEGTVGGFSTERVWLPGRDGPTVHLLHPGRGEEPGEENLLFACGNRGRETAARFDRLAVEALRDSISADVIVMDELGPHEETAEKFHEEVRRILDGETPILGVLQKAESPFLQEVAAHPRVMVITVTEENRDRLPGEILSILEENP